MCLVGALRVNRLTHLVLLSVFDTKTLTHRINRVHNGTTFNVMVLTFSGIDPTELSESAGVQNPVILLEDQLNVFQRS